MNTAGSSRLIFHWDQVRRIPMVLVGFILISAAAHLCTFFLFQVVYPPQASIKAPHASFSVIDPRRPDHQALLRWIDAEDPAPTATGGSNIADRLLNLTYQPSFATMRTAPLPVPETPPTVLYPPARDPLAIIRSAEPKPAPLPPPEVARPTRIVFSSELADRVPDTLSPFTVTTRVSEALDFAEFLIGVSDRGEIRFVFPQRLSTEPNMAPEIAAGEAEGLASEAADRLALLKLKPGTSELTWARVRIDWGAEVYQSSTALKNPSGSKTRQ